MERASRSMSSADLGKGRGPECRNMGSEGLVGRLRDNRNKSFAVLLHTMIPKGGKCNQALQSVGLSFKP